MADIKRCCSNVIYTLGSKDEGADDLEARVAALEAKNAEQDTKIAANEDNTVVKTIVLENGDMVDVLEDGTQVPVENNDTNTLTQAEVDEMYQQS